MKAKAPWHLWVVGVLGLPWNATGACMAPLQRSRWAVLLLVHARKRRAVGALS